MAVVCKKKGEPFVIDTLGNEIEGLSKEEIKYIREYNSYTIEMMNDPFYELSEKCYRPKKKE